MLRYLALKKGIAAQVVFQRRVSPMVENMQKLCLECGSITHAVCRFYKYSPTPYLGARGHVLDDTVHSIGHPFRSLSNVFLTPHLAGGQTVNGRYMQGNFIVRQIERFLAGKVLDYEVTQHMMSIIA